MEEPIRIQRASLDDLPAILDLLDRQFVEHDIRVTGDDLHQAVRHMLRDGRLGLFLLAQAAELSVGLACLSFAWTLEHGGRSAWLDELYVLPEYRGRGVGTALLRKVVQVVQELGCAAIDLEVDQEHRRAERLYQREGFEFRPRRRWVRKITPSQG